MNPFFPFAPLTSHVEHTNSGQLSWTVAVSMYGLYAQLAHGESRLVDTRCFCPGS